VRRQILVAAGLWPMPTKTPLHAVFHGQIDCGQYTIEKVYFENAPRFFVTGNLYRPKNIQGPVLRSSGLCLDHRPSIVGHLLESVLAASERMNPPTAAVA
jgi:hypothetical protein